MTSLVLGGKKKSHRPHLHWKMLPGFNLFSPSVQYLSSANTNMLNLKHTHTGAHTLRVGFGVFYSKFSVWKSVTVLTAAECPPHLPFPALNANADIFHGAWMRIRWILGSELVLRPRPQLSSQLSSPPLCSAFCNACLHMQSQREKESLSLSVSLSLPLCVLCSCYTTVLI